MKAKNRCLHYVSGVEPASFERGKRKGQPDHCNAPGQEKLVTRATAPSLSTHSMRLSGESQ